MNQVLRGLLTCSCPAICLVYFITWNINSEVTISLSRWHITSSSRFSEKPIKPGEYELIQHSFRYLATSYLFELRRTSYSDQFVIRRRPSSRMSQQHPQSDYADTLRRLCSHHLISHSFCEAVINSTVQTKCADLLLISIPGLSAR